MCVDLFCTKFNGVLYTTKMYDFFLFINFELIDLKKNGICILKEQVGAHDSGN